MVTVSPVWHAFQFKFLIVFLFAYIQIQTELQFSWGTEFSTKMYQYGMFYPLIQQSWHHVFTRQKSFYAFLISVVLESFNFLLGIRKEQLPSLESLFFPRYPFSAKYGETLVSSSAQLYKWWICEMAPVGFISCKRNCSCFYIWVSYSLWLTV
jgi:hypothetical protein